MFLVFIEFDMEIGNEISQKIRDAIKTKLKELGSYVDDELPDYIMVMLANKRSKEQMTEDLVLFLGTNTALFTDWLVNIIQKLQDVTSLQENTEQTTLLTVGSIPLQTIKPESDNRKEMKDATLKPSPKNRAQSPHRTDMRENRIRKSEKVERQKMNSNVVKTVGLSSRGSTRKRKHSLSDEEDSRTSNLHSIVKVKERKPTLPLSKQASGNLLMKAVAAAHHSVNKPVLSSSLKYDPTSPPSPIRSHSYEEKQQQKELLLQQHRELQKQFLQMKQEGEGVEEEEHAEEEHAEEESDKEMEGESTEVEGKIEDDDGTSQNKLVKEEHKEVESVQEPEEPVIELHVSETETLEYSTEPVPGDTRIVAFADSQAGGEDSEEERRKRRKKRRAVKSKKPSSPKFIVTLDGVDSDMEDKYDDQVKKEKRKKRSKKKVDVDDFEDIDTSDVNKKDASVTEVPTPEKPVITQITFDLDAAADDESEDTCQANNKQADKCKFWPDCKNGDSCPFYHPTVTCRTFPNCRFGESCRFIHPPCKFDGRCTNSVCPYSHKAKNIKQQTSPIAAPVTGFMFPSPSVLTPPSPSTQPVPCKFYPSCTKADCPFYHPQPKPCRFGLSCTRPNCLFTHPAKPSSLKWVSPALHISERRFALSEKNVTSMPVL